MPTRAPQVTGAASPAGSRGPLLGRVLGAGLGTPRVPRAVRPPWTGGGGGGGGGGGPSPRALALAPSGKTAEEAGERRAAEMAAMELELAARRAALNALEQVGNRARAEADECRAEKDIARFFWIVDRRLRNGYRGP
jgi:hypothetical protein